MKKSRVDIIVSHMAAAQREIQRSIEAEYNDRMDEIGESPLSTQLPAGDPYWTDFNECAIAGRELDGAASRLKRRITD